MSRSLARLTAVAGVLTLVVIARLFLDRASQPSELWTGVVELSELNVRAAPTTSSPTVDRLTQGKEVTVLAWVPGKAVIGANGLWAQIGTDRYVYTHGLAKPKPNKPLSAPADAPKSGRWIDVNLQHQLVTAYEAERPVFWAVASTGRPGAETPKGLFSILHRVENETMASGALAADTYYIRNVLYTQYFTDQGHALHLNYWKWDSPFGVPTSHGCVGLELADAQAFWDFVDVGAPVLVH